MLSGKGQMDILYMLLKEEEHLDWILKNGEGLQAEAKREAGLFPI